MMSRAHALSFLALFAACGDDSGSTADARTADTRLVDAPGDGCDYTEQSDLTNDTTDTGTSEATGLTFSDRVVVCGVIDHTHFQDITVDVDSFTLNVAAETDVIVRFITPGGNALELVGVDVYDSASTLLGTLTYYGNHGVVSAHLPAGTIELLPIALDSIQQTTSIPYRIEVTTDAPDTRCPEITTGGYVENKDGAQNNGNDLITYPMGAPPALTSSPTDVPEPTNFVIAPDLNIRFAGEAADVTTADKYEDTDTYLIATGGGTNELAVRLTWMTSGTDLDWILYEENTLVPVSAGVSSAPSSETKLTAVKPNTNYWLTVNALAGTTVPAPYNGTLCGAQYTP